MLFIAVHSDIKLNRLLLVHRSLSSNRILSWNIKVQNISNMEGRTEYSYKSKLFVNKCVLPFTRTAIKWGTRPLETTSWMENQIQRDYLSKTKYGSVLAQYKKILKLQICVKNNISFIYISISEVLLFSS